MAGTPYSILDNACQPTRRSLPSSTQPGRMNVGAAMWGCDKEHTTSFHQPLDLEPPFPPCDSEALRLRARPDPVYLIPSPHPDCPSCPKSLTRSRRRSLAPGGNNRAVARNANIHNTHWTEFSPAHWKGTLGLNVLILATQRRRFPPGQHRGGNQGAQCIR